MSELSDKLVGSGVNPELSPNPNGSGYVGQVEVDSLPESGIKVNVLYILKDGRQFKYDPANKSWVRVENGPDALKEKGEFGTPVKENQTPKARPHVFNEPVAFNGGVTIKGKSIEDYVDTHGGVTQAEMNAAIETAIAAIPPEITVGSPINLGTIKVTTDGDDVNHAMFEKEITGTELSKIPSDGLCIILFNTTVAIVPFVKAGVNRFVLNAIAYDNGATMVVRSRLDIDGSGPNYIRITFEEAYADALTANTEVRPYAIVKFVKFG